MKHKKKSKLPTIKETEKKGFQIRLSDEEKAKAMEARAIFRRSIGQMFREAFFQYYLPYHYKLHKENNDNRVI